MTGCIAKKVGMSRIFAESGDAIPVTYLKVEPNTVVRTKTEEKDGYNAVVLGVNLKTKKSRKGNELKKYATEHEWQVESLDGIESGAQVTAESIPADSTVTISGTTKGKGFQGVVKRHGFAGGPRTHGSHFHRRGGSIGMCEFPGRVLKGQKMAGRMGGDTQTLKKRSVVACDAAEGIIAVKGPVPGPNGSHVFVTVESTPDA